MRSPSNIHTLSLSRLYKKIKKSINHRFMEAQQEGGSLSKRSSRSDQLTALFDSYRDLSFVLSNPREPDNPILYASESFYETTGYSPSEVIGKNCRFLQGSQTSRQAVGEIRDAIREQRMTSTCLLNYKKDGTPFWNAFHLEPVNDEHGITQFYLGVQCDVTGACSHLGVDVKDPGEFFQNILNTTNKRIDETVMELVDDVKKNSRQLHESGKACVAVDDSICTPLLGALGAIDHAFCLTDPNIKGNPMVYCSPGFLKLTGYSAKELIGKPCSMLQGGDCDEEEIDRIRKAIYSTPPRPVSAVLKNYTKTGESFWNAMYIAPVNCSAGTVKYFCGVQSKVTIGEHDICAMNGPECPDNRSIQDILRQKGVIGAVRVATRGLSDNGLVRKSIDASKYE